MDRLYMFIKSRTDKQLDDYLKPYVFYRVVFNKLKYKKGIIVYTLIPVSHDLLRYDIISDSLWEIHFNKISSGGGHTWNKLTKEDVLKRLNITLRKEKLNKLKKKLHA